MGGVQRARADLASGDVRKARDRLKGLVGTYPDDREVRVLLADAYRRDRQWPEAGRWGYLVDDAASDTERRAFETHAAFAWRSRITEARLRHLLRTADLAAIADGGGRARLRDLPRRRTPRLPDGPLAAMGRALAALRAMVVWR